LNPQSEQYLDWFHATMRITVMSQLAKGLRSRDHPDLSKTVLDELERLKWFLWHGNVYRALETIDGLEFDLDLEGAGLEQRKLLKAVVECGGYIRANGAWIPNYGERYRNGETISSAFVESAVNQIVSKRMVKKQQMRWAPKSAHLLLQVRTSVLNNELGVAFKRRYPSFVTPAESTPEPMELAA